MVKDVEAGPSKGNMLLIFEKRLLRRIHGPVKEDQGITMCFTNYIMN
jgi:hypothetical protein